MIPVKTSLNIQMLVNSRKYPSQCPDFLSREATEPVRHFHDSLKQYAPTPLVELSALAKRLGVAAIYVKDESKRFGLNAFKGLGGVYALCRVVCQQLGLDHRTVTMEQLQLPENREKIEKMVFVTTTDGNHGKGVSWAAGLLGAKSYVYIS